MYIAGITLTLRNYRTTVQFPSANDMIVQKIIVQFSRPPVEGRLAALGRSYRLVPDSQFEELVTFTSASDLTSNELSVLRNEPDVKSVEITPLGSGSTTVPYDRIELPGKIGPNSKSSTADADMEVPASGHAVVVVSLQFETSGTYELDAALSHDGGRTIHVSRFLVIVG